MVSVRRVHPVVCLALLLGGAAARASPTATVQVLASPATPGSTTGSALTGDQINFTIQYTLADAPDGGTVSVDLCAPFSQQQIPYGAPQYQAVSAGATTSAAPCSDGDGRPNLGLRLSWPVSATNGGNTGSLFFWARSRQAITPDGATWTVQATLAAEGANVAQGATQLTLHTAPAALTIRTQFDHAALADAPDGSLRHGYNATFTVIPNNPIEAYWGAPRLGAAPAAGTTTIVDTSSFVDGSGVASAGLLVESHWANADGNNDLLPWFENLYGPGWSGVDTNATQAIAADLLSLTTTVDNLVNTFDAVDYGPGYYVTFWVPLDAGDVSNSVTLTWASTTLTATGSAYLGSVNSDFLFVDDNGFGNNYGCWPGPYRPDVDPTVDNDCYAGPDGIVNLEFQGAPLKPVQGTPALWANPRFVVKIDPGLVLAGPVGMEDCCEPGWRTNPPGWVIEYSGDTGCGPATSTWTPTLAPDAVQCFQLRFTGLYAINDVFVGYAPFKLRPTARAGIAGPGDYTFNTNTGWVLADNQIQINSNPAQPPSTFTSIFWDTEWLRAYLNPTPAADSGFYGYLSTASVGDTFYAQFRAPDDLSSVYSQLDRSAAGWTRLTVDAAFPPEVRMASTDVNTPFVMGQTPVDRQGNPAQITCASNYQGPGKLLQPPNTIHCEVTTADGTDNIPELRPDGSPNTMLLGVPLELVGGTRGEKLELLGTAWTNPPAAYSNGSIPPPPIEQAGTVDMKAHLEGDLTIGGAENLFVTESSAATTVAAGGAVSYSITFGNTGTVSSANTYVYDLLGFDSTTGGALPAGCATDRPTLVSAASTSGAPAPDLEYTLDAAPSPGGNWVLGPLPLDPAGVTGLRFRLNSAFSATAGTYSPFDEQGAIAITLDAPSAGAGSNLCNSVAILADGLAPAPAFASTPITAPPPNCVNVQYSPAQDSFGMVMYEDWWPKNGDLDFNDQTLAYNYAFVLDANGDVTQMQAHFAVLSVGATFLNGAYLHLPMPIGNVPATLTRSYSDGSHDTVAPVAGETEAVIPIVDDTRSLFASSATGFLDTVATQPVVTGKEVAFTITFAAPVAVTAFDIGQGPLDLFIARTHDYGHQVHLARYPGTALMDTTLFGLGGGGDDRSTSTTHFINENGLPFGLAIPTIVPWSLETVMIDQGYPDIDAFAADPSTNQGWYDPSTNTVKPEYLYTLATTAPATFLPDPGGGDACAQPSSPSGTGTRSHR